MSCGCGGAGAANGDLWEARTVGGGALTLASGGTQGTKAEAIEAARGVSGSYLKKV
ncbi:MAG: hypothetical protein ABW360_02735 [Phenylobacterium sp.]